LEVDMKRVLMLATVAWPALGAALAPPTAWAQLDEWRFGGERAVSASPRTKWCAAMPARAGNGLDWCRSEGAGLGVRRAEDGGDGDDDHRDERGNGDAHGRADLDGGRHADDHADPRNGAERWERADWGDVRFRLSQAVLSGVLSQAQLEALLGRGVVARLTRHAYEERVDGELQGRWLSGSPRVLRVYGGRVPVAEFTDRDRDDRVELLRLAYWR
jgi:hypothetical protein